MTVPVVFLAFALGIIIALKWRKRRKSNGSGLEYLGGTTELEGRNEPTVEEAAELDRKGNTIGYSVELRMEKSVRE